MKKIALLLFMYLFAFQNTYSQSGISKSDQSLIKTFIDQTREKLGIPGLAVAIIKNKDVVYQDYLGYANLEHMVPVAKESLFRLHSLSKIFVSVSIFQLIEANKISLVDPISKYLNDLPDSWQEVKIGNLLSHSSGLPDMREESLPKEEDAKEKVYNKEIQFECGTAVSYNQTNFWLLNRIIQDIDSTNFQDIVLTQFANESQARFSNVDDIVNHRVTEYNPSESGQLKHYHFYVGDYMYGAGGLTVSLDDMIHWDQQLSQNKMISEKSKMQMFEKFDYQTAVPYEFSYGWFIQNINNIPSYGFNGGGLVNYRHYPEKDISIIWLTNGYAVPYNIDDVTNTLFGYIDEELKDKTEEAQKEVYNLYETKSCRKAKKEYRKVKKKYPFVNIETVLNNIGYYFMSQKSLEKAIAVFELNTEDHPHSANTFDSLGEAYLENKELQRSLENYQKSLALDPSSENAKQKIELIKEQLGK